MATPELLTTASPFLSPLRPRDEEVDLFGLTHVGKVRKENQDHFMLCTVHPQVHMHGTSLPRAGELPLRGERIATIMLVADGVGSTTGGGDASQLVVETITRYVASSLRCYHAAGTSRDGEFEDALRAAALEAHAAVRAEAASRADSQRMATTMTLAIVIWPWVYVVQVGDSRCYHYLNGALRQVTRDQTMAQALVDEGALPRESLETSPLSHVLVSSLGGDSAAPEVTKLDIKNRDSVLLLCSDGLTKHVSDEEIAQAIGRMQSSEQLCRDLLALVLERGGSDNVTILSGRAPRNRRLSGS
jgi:serine/threonine protein phosphatase PrpC